VLFIIILCDDLEVYLVNNAGTKLSKDAQVYAQLLDENSSMKDLVTEDLVEENFDPLPKGTPKVGLKPLLHISKV
jgi:hypothetical protein